MAGLSRMIGQEIAVAGFARGFLFVSGTFAVIPREDRPSALAEAGTEVPPESPLGAERAA